VVEKTNIRKVNAILPEALYFLGMYLTEVEVLRQIRKGHLGGFYIFAQKTSIDRDALQLAIRKQVVREKHAHPIMVINQKKE
jgi:hypothetical protein